MGVMVPALTVCKPSYFLYSASLSRSCARTELHMERACISDQCSNVLVSSSDIMLSVLSKTCEMELVTPFCK